MSQSSRLFAPLKLGKSQLQHRIAMAPLTRYRADDDHVPTPMMAEYYGQRASVPGTLLITEATFIAPSSGGYRNAPGIWNDAQVAAWSKVTEAVHAKGSFVYLQLWDLGRAAKQEVLDAEGLGHRVKSASNLPIDGSHDIPEALTLDEIRSRVRDYANAARNAARAGFDGVEIHGANGYLIDQFIQDVSNTRTDEYGGSVENRSRFAVEVVDAVVEAMGDAERVGIRLSPWSVFQSMRMEDPIPQFTDVVSKINRHKLAFIHLVQGRIAGNTTVPDELDESLDFAVKAFDGPVLIAGGLTAESARELVDDKYPDKDVVAVFGRHFISTPDLPFRAKEGIPFNEYDRETFYIPKSAVGYTDQPFSKEFEAQYGVNAEVPN